MTVIKFRIECMPKCPVVDINAFGEMINTESILRYYSRSLKAGQIVNIQIKRVLYNNNQFDIRWTCTSKLKDLSFDMKKYVGEYLKMNLVHVGDMIPAENKLSPLPNLPTVQIEDNKLQEQVDHLPNEKILQDTSIEDNTFSNVLSIAEGNIDNIFSDMKKDMSDIKKLIEYCYATCQEINSKITR